MKNVREYYIQCLEGEKPAFVRVLKAIPQDRADYKPHERSTSARDIAWLLATELSDACELIDHGEVNYVEQPGPTMSEILGTYERNATALQAKIANVDDAKWSSRTRLKMNGKVVWEAPLGEMLFGFLFDAIHHRGQLSSYLRPMGAKVPSIYGPSGDDPGN